jgi:hypothetical protein
MSFHRTLGLLLAILIFSLSSDHAKAADDILELTATHYGGGLDMRYDWKLQLRGSEITIERPGKKPRTKKLSVSAISSFRRSIDENNFASLSGPYGCIACTDNPLCKVSLKTGSSSYEVRVYAYFSPERLDSDLREAAEVSRFISIWRMIKQVSGLRSVKDFCP